MKYAVVKIKGHQYRVFEGDEILVDKVGSDEVEPEVLLVADGDKVAVGKPLVKGAKVKAKVLQEEKGEKIRVSKYRAKSRYRKVRGFRSSLTRLLIEKISI
jgi:large subunit ribosomal protein L21